jgi:hypothetical protein
MSLLDTASLIVTPNGYKEGKLYSVIPSDGSGDLSVTRATTATRVNSAGLVESIGNNVPRLDYSNGTCPSLLVEPQRTNYINYSSSFDNAAWEKQLGASVTANTTTAPDGTMSADTLTIAPNQYMYQLQGLSSGTSYTISFYCKVASGTKQFNMVTYSPSGNINYSPTLTATTEWQRFEFTITANATASTSIYPVLVDSFASGSFFIWGAQVEVGSYATSYIPTTSASVTRNADVISKTGISSLIGQTEGTLFVDVYRPTSNSPFIFMLANSTGANAYLNSLYLYQVDTSQLTFDVFVSGALQASIATSSSGLSVGRHKIAFAYKQNDFVLYVDGTQIGTDTSGNVPTLSAFEVNNVDIGSTSNFDINSVALWKTKLDNATLAQLTTI